MAKMFYKVIEVNLNEDTYFEVKLDAQPVIYKSVRKWVEAFAEEGVYPADKERFLEFFDPFKLKAGAEHNWQRVYYRRLMEDGNWRWVCMEVIPEENFDRDDPIVLIVVRDVEDYIRDFQQQVGHADLD